MFSSRFPVWRILPWNNDRSILGRAQTSDEISRAGLDLMLAGLWDSTPTRNARVDAKIVSTPNAESSSRLCSGGSENGILLMGDVPSSHRPLGTEPAVFVGDGCPGDVRRVTNFAAAAAICWVVELAGALPRRY